MTFHSILFERTEGSIKKETLEAPDFFIDLNLDQVIDAITANRQEYHLQPFFYTSLHDIDAIMYRHEIMRDLENQTLFEHIRSFAQKMRTMRAYLAQADKLYYTYQKERWFLDAVAMYCEAVTCLAHDVSLVDVQSRGFLAFREYVTGYASSDRFTSLLAQTKKLQADLSTVKYSLLIKGSSVTVRKYEAERDYSAEVEETFAKFKQGAVKDYRVKFRNLRDMDHVEAQILELVAKLYPDIFSQLDDYCAKNGQYLDETLSIFDREIQFYLAYLEYIVRLKGAGLPFCYPHISNTGKEVYDYDGFDVALAYKLVTANSSVVCNDFYLKGKQRVVGNDLYADGKDLVIITGANQGGKSTFLRSIGLAQVMMQCGMFVPAESFCANVCESLFTHYKRKEDPTMKSGKLDEELSRMSEIVDKITSNSMLLLNESFAATNEREGSEIARQIVSAILEKRIKVFFVTHLYEFAHSFYDKHMGNAMFLRADRQPDGRRTFKLIEGEPLQTSFGQDVYHRIFGTDT